MIATDTQGRRVLLAEYANPTTREALWKFEDPQDGETYTIEIRNGRWSVSLDVWNDETQDWEGDALAMTVNAFLRHHHIHALVTGSFHARS